MHCAATRRWWDEWVWKVVPRATPAEKLRSRLPSTMDNRDGCPGGSMPVLASILGSVFRAVRGMRGKEGLVQGSLICSVPSLSPGHPSLTTMNEMDMFSRDGKPCRGTFRRLSPSKPPEDGRPRPVVFLPLPCFVPSWHQLRFPLHSCPPGMPSMHWTVIRQLCNRQFETWRGRL